MNTNKVNSCRSFGLLTVVALSFLFSMQTPVKAAPGDDADADKVTKGKAIEKLLQLFELPEPGERRRHQTPPQFMLDLYNTIADEDGVTRARNPYGARVVRSFIERGNSQDSIFVFNVTGLEEHERIIQAELHLFRLKETIMPSANGGASQQTYFMLYLYQILDGVPLTVPEAHRLLGVHYVPTRISGWEVFNVTLAVMEWRNGSRPNLGFLISAATLVGDAVTVRFARAHQRHPRKQPILVLFDDDLAPTPAAQPVPTLDPRLSYPHYHHSLLRESHWNEVEVAMSRKRRSVDTVEEVADITGSGIGGTGESAPATTSQPPVAVINSTECTRHDLQVSFEAIGWDWIIAPKGYNAYQCRGKCNFPLGQQQRPTNHATVQSIVHELKLHGDVHLPCCVPHSLLSLSLLYYDDQNNVVLKQYEDMVADGCGCH